MQQEHSFCTVGTRIIIFLLFVTWRYVLKANIKRSRLEFISQWKDILLRILTFYEVISGHRLFNLEGFLIGGARSGPPARALGADSDRGAARSGPQLTIKITGIAQGALQRPRWRSSY